MRLTLLSFLFSFPIFFMSGCFDGTSKSDASGSGDTSPNTLNAGAQEGLTSQFKNSWEETETELEIIDADDTSLDTQNNKLVKQPTPWFKGSADDLTAGYEDAEDFRNGIIKKVLDTLKGASVKTVYVDYFVDNTNNSWGVLPNNMNKVTIAYTSFESPKLKPVNSMLEMVDQLLGMLNNKTFKRVDDFTTEMYDVLVKKTQEDECTTDCIEVVQFRFDFDDGRILRVTQNRIDETLTTQFVHIVEKYCYSIDYIKI